MDVGIVGLGRMGLGMGTRLVRRGHNVAGHDTSPTKQTQAEANGIHWAATLRGLGSMPATPRIIIIMVPAGPPVDSVIDELAPTLSPEDIVIDGGNSFYKDSIRRAVHLRDLGLSFLDVGVSGGVWGLENGYCLMAGGDSETYKTAEPVLADLAQDGGLAHVGESGSRHR